MPDETSFPDQAPNVPHSTDVGEDDGRDREKGDTQAGGVAAVDVELIISIRSLYRRRRAYHRAEKSLILQRKAQERWAAVERLREDGGELPKGKFPTPSAADEATIAALYPEFGEAQALMRAAREALEKQLRTAAMQLPVYATFVAPLCGMGALALAIIVGEAGDIGGYANPAKLWKRMGVGLVQTADGQNIRQRRAENAELALQMGYDPQRRSALFTIGDSLIKKQNVYRELYLTKKAEYAAREDCRSQMQAHRRAQRFMEKRLLLELWRAWRAAIEETSSEGKTPSAAPPETGMPAAA
jgi:hypothetical protein